MSDQMTTERAIEIVLDIAARYSNTARAGREEGEIRDLWHATDLLNKLLEQRGCEHFDRACKDGKLTTLADIVIFG